MSSESPVDLRHIRFDGKAFEARRASAAPVPLAASAPVQGPSRATNLPKAVDPFPGWVLAQAGLDPESYRSTPLGRRVPACLRALQVASTAEARVRLQKRPDLVPDAVTMLLIGVTQFWRDADVFAALRTMVLPAIRQRRVPVRIWSAACSTGEELYTMAILLADAGLLDTSELVGTDCRADAIESAAQSVYAASSLDSVPEAARLRYFERVGARESRPIFPLRKRTRWRVADLLQEVEPGPWDIILWRNNAIYLDPNVAAAVFARLISQLSAGGFLVVGKAERPPAGAPLTSVCRCIYRKDGETHARQ